MYRFSVYDLNLEVVEQDLGVEKRFLTHLNTGKTLNERSNF